MLRHVVSYFGTLMMEAASTSETSVDFYQPARRSIVKDTHI
jgi:hypothetical protein